MHLGVNAFTPRASSKEPQVHVVEHVRIFVARADRARVHSSRVASMFSPLGERVESLFPLVGRQDGGCVYDSILPRSEPGATACFVDWRVWLFCCLFVCWFVCRSVCLMLCVTFFVCA
jgi:hypothetical protein